MKTSNQIQLSEQKVKNNSYNLKQETFENNSQHKAIVSEYPTGYWR